MQNCCNGDSRGEETGDISKAKQPSGLTEMGSKKGLRIDVVLYRRGRLRDVAFVEMLRNNKERAGIT
jgi:hypothetical protein